MSEGSLYVDAPAAIDATYRPRWRRTGGIELAMALGLVLATLGVLTSRVDVVLLALPLLASAALARDGAPGADGASRVRIDLTRHDDPARPSEFRYRVAIEAPVTTTLVHLRLTTPGARVHDLLLAPRALVTVMGAVPVVHSGRQRVVAVGMRLVGGDGAWMTAATPTVAAERVVDPELSLLGSIPLPHRLTGMAGAHASVRPGDGGEFRDLHAYAPGDRLRRIDWKATARRSRGLGDLYVRRTAATSDATVVLVLDSRDDVGERVASWSGAPGGASGLTTMDLTREAATSLAAAAIGAGDRVSLIDLAAHEGMVVAGSGKRHLDRLRRRIAVSGPVGVRPSRRRAPIVPVGAIVYLLSPLLDDDVTWIATVWRAAGHRLIVVDVLPAPQLDGSAAHTRLAHRLLMAERQRRVAMLRDHGVELLRWQEDAAQPSRVVALRTLARGGARRTVSSVRRA